VFDYRMAAIDDLDAFTVIDQWCRVPIFRRNLS
jgi:hypothetical protein